MTNAKLKAVPPEEGSKTKKQKRKVPKGVKPMEDHLYDLHAKSMGDLVPDLENRKPRVLHKPDFPNAAEDSTNWGMMGKILKALKKK
jgi:hypothetical protein